MPVNPTPVRQGTPHAQARAGLQGFEAINPGTGKSGYFLRAQNYAKSTGSVIITDDDLPGGCHRRLGGWVHPEVTPPSNLNQLRDTTLLFLVLLGAAITPGWASPPIYRICIHGDLCAPPIRD
jgi:hypothetical protein